MSTMGRPIVVDSVNKMLKTADFLPCFFLLAYPWCSESSLGHTPWQVFNSACAALSYLLNVSLSDEQLCLVFVSTLAAIETMLLVTVAL